MQTIKLGTITAADVNALNVNNGKANFSLTDNYTPAGNFVKDVYVKFNEGFKSTSNEFPTFELKINEESLMSNGAIALNAVQPDQIPLPEVVSVWQPKIGQLKFPAPADNYLELVFPNGTNPADYTEGSISFYATVEDFQV